MPQQVLNWLSFMYRLSLKPGVIQYIYHARIGRVQNLNQKNVRLYVVESEKIPCVCFESLAYSYE
jgi:hypothetical protein